MEVILSIYVVDKSLTRDGSSCHVLFRFLFCSLSFVFESTVGGEGSAFFLLFFLYKLRCVSKVDAVLLLLIVCFSSCLYFFSSFVIYFSLSFISPHAFVSKCLLMSFRIAACLFASFGRCPSPPQLIERLCPPPLPPLWKPAHTVKKFSH